MQVSATERRAHKLVRRMDDRVCTLCVRCGRTSVAGTGGSAPALPYVPTNSSMLSEGPNVCAAKGKVNAGGETDVRRDTGRCGRLMRQRRRGERIRK